MVQSELRHGMAETILNTLRRGYATNSDLSDAPSMLSDLSTTPEHFIAGQLTSGTRATRLNFRH